MVEVLAFQVDLGPAALPAEPLGVVQRRRPADVVAIERRQLILKRRVADRPLVLGGQLLQCLGEGFRHVAAAEGAKAAGGRRGTIDFLRAWQGFSLENGSCRSWQQVILLDLRGAVKPRRQESPPLSPAAAWG